MLRNWLKDLTLRAKMLSFWVLNLGVLMVALPDLASLFGWDMGHVGSVVRLLGLLKAVLGALQQPSFGVALQSYVDSRQS